MSSHHIVRENQEPALMIANGEACSFELLGQLLEWSPYILTLDGALPRVASLGIKVDAVLGDFDSVGQMQEIIAEQQPIIVVNAPNQDKTDLEKGIEWLIEKGHKAINIVWATGLRADHTLNNIYSLAKYKYLVNIVMIDNYSRIFVLGQKFEKWYQANTILSLMPVNRVEGVSTQGLAYTLNDEVLEAGIRSGSSNHVLQDGFVTITHSKGDLILMECHD
ncbi:MAG: thiamine diphosphokinase [Bacteroidetes bacterium]|nr:thiamine diphosphokinase [Bacteroidota bacterium]